MSIALDPGEAADQALFAPIRPAQVRYIKLGLGGRWEAQSLAEGRIYWGIAADPVQEALRGDWDAAEARYRLDIANKGSATDALRQLREFFTLGTDTLWITFARGSMWWAFSERAELVADPAGDPAPIAFRRTLAPWSNRDRFGHPLDQARISTKLTQTSAYRQAICDVKHADYAVRRINGEEEVYVGLLRAQRAALIAAAADVIRDLHWRDFELLVDLIFSGAGWRRVSELGGGMKDIDLLLEQPITGERISVQVKSKIDQAVADRCISAFQQGGSADRFFLVHHTGKASMDAIGAGRAEIWGCDALAQRAVDAGLTAWLASRAA